MRPRTHTQRVKQFASIALTAVVIMLAAIVAAPTASASPESCYGQFCGEKAAAWARAHAEDTPKYESDCTWFVSQALWFGGMPDTAKWTHTSMDDDNRGGSRARGDMAFWPTRTATIADELKNYLVNDAGVATITQLSWRNNNVFDAKLGDLIAYDWDLHDGKHSDGIIDHLAMVTGFSDENPNYPLVSQHSPGQTNRGWTYSEGAGTWIEHDKPGASVYLIHFVD
nr:amidase domain-containing protein [Rhodococcus sp. (in: high G+C Gram-positive bacteria)]